MTAPGPSQTRACRFPALDSSLDRSATGTAPWARAIADAGRGELRRQIACKAPWAQRTHIEVDRWFPSTSRCSACHAHCEVLTLADRQWRCEASGAEAA